MVPSRTQRDRGRQGGAAGNIHQERSRRFVVGFFVAGPTDLLLAGGQRLSVPGGVVIWQRGAVTLRSETLLARTDAVRLAATIS